MYQSLDRLTADEFLNLTPEVDQPIIERQFLDEAREMASSGVKRPKIVEALRLAFLRADGSYERWISLYPAAVDAATRACREATEALGGRAELEPPTPLTIDELHAARISPECFVDGLIFADVRILAGAGGLGKSTLLLFELTTIAGGADRLWGRSIDRPRPVVYVTKEDTRETIAARLRQVIEANGMMFRTKRILASFYILDLSGAAFRLTTVEGDSVVSSGDVDRVIEWLKAIEPAIVAFDPAVSFGVGESRINDAEQGLIEAARRIRNALGCCVTFVHHVGKANAREGAVDQYAGRGGSALADGARMVNVLVPLDRQQWAKATGSELAEGEVGLRLALAKGTFAPPQPDVLIRRRGFMFQHEVATAPVGNFDEERADRVLDFLQVEIAAGRFPTLRTTEGQVPGLSRAATRTAIDRLTYQGLVERTPIPNKTGRGGAREYLKPVGSDVTRTSPPPHAPPVPPEKPDIAAPVLDAPLRERRSGAAIAAAAPSGRWRAEDHPRTNGAPTHQSGGTK